ncbi:MAG: PDZ domain-containing protein, partial [Casimicrobiaceae bacterium]
YTAETRDGVTIQGLAQGGPAERAGLQPGDIVRDVAGEPVEDLADFYRHVWKHGPAGTPIPLTLTREGRLTSVSVPSVDRSSLLKKPQLQ